MKVTRHAVVWHCTHAAFATLAFIRSLAGTCPSAAQKDMSSLYVRNPEHTGTVCGTSRGMLSPEQNLSEQLYPENVWPIRKQQPKQQQQQGDWQYSYIHMSVYIYIHTHLNVCVYVYIYIYIYTYIMYCVIYIQNIYSLHII